jgi:hypothetical protein
MTVNSLFGVDSFTKNQIIIYNMHLLGVLASLAAFAFYFFTPKAQRPQKKNQKTI